MFFRRKNYYTAEEAIMCLAFATKDQSVLSTLPTSPERQKLLLSIMLKANPALKRLPIDSTIATTSTTPKHKGNGFDPNDSRGFNQQGRQKNRVSDDVPVMSRVQVWGRRFQAAVVVVCVAALVALLIIGWGSPLWAVVTGLLK